MVYLVCRAHLLNPGEKALFYSAAHLKHRGIFQPRPQLKPRLIILTDQGRLLCVKTSVPASSQAEEPHKKRGDIVTPVAKIKSEVLLATAFPSSPTRSSPMSPAPASSRRGSSVGQGSGGSTKRRLSVSTTASRISIRGRSVHRRGAETLMGAEATKGDGTLVIQTVSRLRTAGRYSQNSSFARRGSGIHTCWMVKQLRCDGGRRSPPPNSDTVLQSILALHSL